MALLYHTSLITADVGRAAAFYDKVLAPLGAERLADKLPLIVGYGMPGEEASFYIQSKHAGPGSQSGDFDSSSPYVVDLNPGLQTRVVRTAAADCQSNSQ